MAIQWQPAPTSYGTFKDTLFEFFKLLEAPKQQDRLNLHVVNGNLTIGIGFDLDAGKEPVRKAVFDAFDIDYYYPANHADAQPGSPEAIESKYITDLIAAVQGSNPAAVNAIMYQRAHDTRLDGVPGISQNRRASFSFYNDTEVKNVFSSLWDDVYSKRIFDKLPALKGDADFNKSRELLALGSYAWNTGTISDSTCDGINKGDRAEAWYGIRYTRYISEGVEMAGLVKRRFFESEVFGLYNDQNNVETDEAKQVFQMLQRHRADIARKEADYGVSFDGKPGTILINGESVREAANIDFQSMRTVFISDGEVNSLVENLDPAKDALFEWLNGRSDLPDIENYLTANNIVSTNIYLAANPNQSSTLELVWQNRTVT